MKNALRIIAAVLALSSFNAHAIHATTAASMTHSVFLDAGNVHAMGLNNYHQTNPYVASPVAAYPQTSSESVRVPTYTGVNGAVSVAAANNRTVVLKNDGTIQFWGNTQSNATTLPINPFPSLHTVVDIAMTNLQMYIVAGNSLYSWDYNVAYPKLETVAMGNVESVAAGDDHIVILYKDGTVGTAGGSAFGQRGTPEVNMNPLNVFVPYTVKGITNAVEIAAGGNMTFVRTATAVYAFGKNQYSQLGLNNTDYTNHPVQVPVVGTVKKMAVNFAAAFLLMSDNTVQAAGFHDYIAGSVYTGSKVFTTLPGLTQVTQLFAGGQQVFVDLGMAGQVRGWGGNANGQLGDNTITERHTPTYAYYTPVRTAAPAPYVAPTPVYVPLSVNPPVKAAAPVAYAPVVTPTPAPVVVAPVTTSPFGPVVVAKPVVVTPVVTTPVVVVPAPVVVAPKPPVVVVAPVVVVPVVDMCHTDNGKGNNGCNKGNDVKKK